MNYPIKKEDLLLPEIENDEQATMVVVQAYLDGSISELEINKNISLESIIEKLKSWSSFDEFKRTIENQNDLMNRTFASKLNEKVDSETSNVDLVNKALSKSKNQDFRSEKFLKLASIAAAFLFVTMSFATLFNSQNTTSGTKSNSKISQVNSGAPTQDQTEIQEEKFENSTSGLDKANNSSESNSASPESDFSQETDSKSSLEALFKFGSQSNILVLFLSFLLLASAIFFLLRFRRK